MKNLSWNPGAPVYPGYNRPVTRELSLKERLDIANRMSSKELDRHLAWHSDSYTAETLTGIVSCVLSMSKPLAEILDDLHIPRETTHVEFVQLDGPPLPPSPDSLVIRRVTPRHIRLDDLGVQPMFKHISDLPIVSFTRTLELGK